MPITTEPYSQAKIDSIANLLVVNAEQDTPIDYEVFVDTLKVIPRTDDASRFESYSDFVNADTRSLTIILYNGQSNRNDKYIFRFKEDKSNGLQGIGVADRINEKLTTERQKWDFEQLETKNQKLKKELKEAGEYIDELEESIVKLRNRKFHLGNINLGELGSVMLEGFIRRNPQIISKLPGGEALAGVIEEDNQRSETITPDSAVEVTPKSTSPTEEELEYIDLLSQIRKAFNEQDFIKIMQILDTLSREPARLAEVLETLQVNKQENDQELNL